MEQKKQWQRPKRKPKSREWLINQWKRISQANENKKKKSAFKNMKNRYTLSFNLLATHQ